MHVYGEIYGRLTGCGTINGSLTIPAGTGTKPYKGPYQFTPTAYTQTVEIAEQIATQDITINPIPSNYGLITWNGSTLTVS